MLGRRDTHDGEPGRNAAERLERCLSGEPAYSPVESVEGACCVVRGESDSNLKMPFARGAEI